MRPESFPYNRYRDIENIWFSMTDQSCRVLAARHFVHYHWGMFVVLVSDLDWDKFAEIVLGWVFVPRRRCRVCFFGPESKCTAPKQILRNSMKRHSSQL